MAIQDDSLFGRDAGGGPAGPFNCLGVSFSSHEERRAHFTSLLREKLKDPEFRSIEGFPIGDDADILALSDPPYHTACPNPWLTDFVQHYGKAYDSETDTYVREPFAVDVSEGKTDALYKAHSYHTKVPHLAIVPSILHYTEPGDIVLDGFSGSGMTAVAAQWCGSAPSAYRRALETTWMASRQSKPQWGARIALLNDLSPAATSIAENYNLPLDVDAFAMAGRQLLDRVQLDLGWMYETRHTDGSLGRIDYTVWSEVFGCPECAGEVVFYDAAFDTESKRVRDRFPCPSCGTELTRTRLTRLYESRFDRLIDMAIQTPKRKPVLIVYSAGGRHFEKKPDGEDIAILKRIGATPPPPSSPSGEIPRMHMTHERARMDYSGVTHLHHFFLPRAAHAMAELWGQAEMCGDARTRHMLLFFVDQAIWTASILNRFRPTGYSQVNQYLSGVYYVPSQHAECSPWYILEGKLARLTKGFRLSPARWGQAAITTGTAARLPLPEDCVDYVFTDPPFGENIYYADLNFLVESWYRVTTDAAPEAIIDRFKKKGLPEYQHLMQACFEEYSRVLKPGRWMTVVFHNSRNAVWNSIQEALTAAGFVVADVRTMDKQQGSYRQVTSTAVKQDLVISAYKPTVRLEQDFGLRAGTIDGAMEFVRTHLGQLPVVVTKDGALEIVAERQAYLLYDRMVAFHVQRGVQVPLSSAEFRTALEDRFPYRDGMYFLPEQVAEYDRKRMQAQEVRQLELFVTDEDSAIQWLRQLLDDKPQTLQELVPQFMREIAGWEKFEKHLELHELLIENFLRYDGVGEVPGPVHGYLSHSYREMRGLDKDDPTLRSMAKDRWYVPDARRATDLEHVRERTLLKEFDDYANGKGKLKLLRLEAVRAGFKRGWQERDYRMIISVAERLPLDVLQEDAKLLMWYDQALTRVGE
jgi:hypothetical protein